MGPKYSKLTSYDSAVYYVLTYSCFLKNKVVTLQEMTGCQGWGLVSISTLVNKAEEFVIVPIDDIREEDKFGHHNCISDLQTYIRPLLKKKSCECEDVLFSICTQLSCVLFTDL